MKRFEFLLTLLAMTTAPVFGVIHPNAGTLNSSILNSQPGVRPAGMGNAYTAVAEDIHSVYANPAGLGYLRHAEINMIHSLKYEEISESHVAFSIPTGLMSAGNLSNFGTFAGSIGLVDYGHLDARDRSGNPSSLDLKSKEVMAMASYGKSVYERLSVGFSAKYYILQYSEAFVRDFAYDFGFQYKIHPDFCKAGFAVKNLGNSIRLIQTDEDLPRSVTAGIAVTPWGGRVTVAFDVEDPEDNYPAYKSGGEFWVNNMFAVRAGYNSSNDMGTGVTAGFSLRVREIEAGFFPIRHLTLDYAFVPQSRLGDVHRFGLTFRFGDR